MYNANKLWSPGEIRVVLVNKFHPKKNVYWEVLNIYNFKRTFRVFPWDKKAQERVLAELSALSGITGTLELGPIEKGTIRSKALVRFVNAFDIAGGYGFKTSQKSNSSITTAE